MIVSVGGRIQSQTQTVLASVNQLGRCAPLVGLVLAIVWGIFEARIDNVVSSLLNV